jgi:hypothetical protein
VVKNDKIERLAAKAFQFRIANKGPGSPREPLGDGGPAISATLNDPVAIAVDPPAHLHCRLRQQTHTKSITGRDEAREGIGKRADYLPTELASPARLAGSNP